MYMIMFVLNDTDNFDEIIDAWNDIGVNRVTVMPSTGLGKLKRAALRDDLPLIPSLDDLIAHSEIASRTLFAVVKNEEVIDQLVSQTEKIIGDLNKPNTGVIFVFPVARAYGLEKQNT